MKPFKKGIFLFHRDLRLFDNTGLIMAMEQCEEVLPLFIFDPKQSDPQINTFFNPNFFNCFIHSLHDLQISIQKHTNTATLQIATGETEKVLFDIIEEYHPNAFFSNADYSAFGRNRDQKIIDVCTQQSCRYHFVHDQCLSAPGTVLKKDGTPYTIFTPFFKVASAYPVVKCQDIPTTGIMSSFVYSKTQALSLPNPPLFDTSRDNAIKYISRISSAYAENRNFPAHNQNTNLSAFLRMGVVSIREVFWAFFKKFGEDSQGITELYWRDFFIHIGYHFPKIFQGKCFHEKYNSLYWENDPVKFEAWKNGETGFPLVDAGMKELQHTGLMHNRVRMVAASFLVKNLNIDWKWGEKYFAQMLIDYDYCVNNGNWQWAASTGCDNTPYFRIFSPTSQHKRFDPESIYIKKWIPTLQNIQTKDLLLVEKKRIIGYPAPIIDSKKIAEYSKEKYKMIHS